MFVRLLGFLHCPSLSGAIAAALWWRLWHGSFLSSAAREGGQELPAYMHAVVRHAHNCEVPYGSKVPYVGRHH